MKDLRDLQRIAKEMQASMEKAQTQLADETVEGTAGGGAVTVVMSGTQEVRSVRISKDAVDPDDVETLQDLVLAAVKDATQRSKDLAANKLGGITGGLKLP
ncbi:MAG: YbaB/EbfC family nucleoid-associated protein [Actinobacteria bacterium]|nr:YbaB/EbfC family nucleoid-associated protein [Actinomycetota bacterium]